MTDPIEGYLKNDDNKGLENYLQKNQITKNKLLHLFDCIEYKCSPSTLKVLIDNGCSTALNERHLDECVLQYALRQDSSLKIIKCLIDSGSDPKTRDALDNSTLLHECVTLKKPFEYIKFLMTCVPLGLANDRGETFLHYALSSNIVDFEMLMYVLDQGHPLNLRDNKHQTPLHLACIMDIERDVIETMIKKGAKLDVLDLEKKDPLGCLIDHNPGIRTLKVFCDYGSDLSSTNVRGQSLLHKTCNSNFELLDFLLERNVNLNAQNNAGQTAIHLALTNENITKEIIRKLIDRGADLNIQTLSRLETPLAVYLRNYHEKHDPEITKLLILHSDLNLTDFSDMDPLGIALKESLPFAIVKFIIENGANVHATNKKKENCLHQLFNSKRPIDIQILKYLLKKGVSITQFSENGYPLFTAIRKSPLTLEIANLLTNKDIDFSRKIPTKDPLIFRALKNPNATVEICEFLYLQGADLFKQSTHKDLLLNHLIFNQYDPDIVNFFLDLNTLDVNQISPQKKNAVMDAAYIGEINYLKKMKIQGADFALLVSEI
ncbi:ankyrin repeat-containing protein [Anaeramoeba flamelloides]|uniref:Ankyrin repeat-containing protein n=1 Tax=Anaeramoeba flamelloides TaxID=1746091 RepID=A0ABQ8YQL3_9EUKA|nr:ankyrin repeat-containing protein [Anaeramoeba flamelloides]